LAQLWPVGGHRQSGPLLTAPLIGSAMASGRAQAAQASPHSSADWLSHGRWAGTGSPGLSSQPCGQGQPFSPPWWPKPFVCREQVGEMPSCCQSGRAAGTRGSCSTHTEGTGGDRALPRSFCSLSLGSGLGLQPSTSRGFPPGCTALHQGKGLCSVLISLQAYTFPFFHKFLSFLLPPPHHQYHFL